MRTRIAIVACAILGVLVFAGESAAIRDAMSVRGERGAGASKIDNTGHCDANNIDFVVTNHGSLMYDLVTGDPGLVYPRGTTKTAIFAAGLWLGAKVNDSLRVTVGEYSQEFVPGPMVGGATQPTTRGSVYRIERGNTTSDDYRNWPVRTARRSTRPETRSFSGDVTLWSVYNDADASVHSNRRGQHGASGRRGPADGVRVQPAEPARRLRLHEVPPHQQGEEHPRLDVRRVLVRSRSGERGRSRRLRHDAVARLRVQRHEHDPIYGTPSSGRFRLLPGTPRQRRAPPDVVVQPVHERDRPARPDRPTTTCAGSTPTDDYEYPPGTPVHFQISGDPVADIGDLDTTRPTGASSSPPGRSAWRRATRRRSSLGWSSGRARTGSARSASCKATTTSRRRRTTWASTSPLPPPPRRSCPRARSIARSSSTGATDSERFISNNDELGQEYHFEGYNVYQGESDERAVDEAPHVRRGRLDRHSLRRGLLARHRRVPARRRAARNEHRARSPPADHERRDPRRSSREQPRLLLRGHGVQLRREPHGAVRGRRRGRRTSLAVPRSRAASTRIASMPAGSGASSARRPTTRPGPATARWFWSTSIPSRYGTTTTR